MSILIEISLYNFKFNFLSQCQLESLSLDKLILPVFKMLSHSKDFLVTSFLPILLKCSVETISIFFIGHTMQEVEVFSYMLMGVSVSITS